MHESKVVANAMNLIRTDLITDNADAFDKQSYHWLFQNIKRSFQEE